jgi:hypothetical protein
MADIDGDEVRSYRYVVQVDDNFDYQNEEKRYTHSEHVDPAVALQTAKDIVDACLGELHKPSMSAEDLYRAYTSFGEDPFIQTRDPGFARFSAWSYAKQRCKVICDTSSDAPDRK